MSTFPNDNYNHFPRYQGKFSGEEIDELLSTVKNWTTAGENGSGGSLVFSNTPVKSLQDWWKYTALANTVSETNATQAISGLALSSWWSEKYTSQANGSWSEITADKVPSKGLIDGQLRTRASKYLSYRYTSLAANQGLMPASEYQWSSDDNNTWILSGLETYSQPTTKISLILVMHTEEISTGSSVTGSANLKDMEVYSSGTDQNPFVWTRGGSSQRVISDEWTSIRINPSSPFSSMDTSIPKIYLTPGNSEFVDNEWALSCFNFVNRMTLQDGQKTLYVYEGICFPMSAISTLKDATNPGDSLLEMIHTASSSNGEDLKKSYIIFEVGLETINVYWNLVAAV